MTKPTSTPCPFLILIDTAEQQPFPFTGIRADAAAAHAVFAVRTKRMCLGRYPDSLGDYSLEGGFGRCHVERKSMADAQSTILGWGIDSEFGCSRRERFERELLNLSQVECGCVVVECSFAEMVAKAPEYGKKTAQENAVTLHRSVVAYQQDFSVPWFFCDSRRMAEITAFRWLYRWWKKQDEERRKREREAKKQTPLLVSEKNDDLPF